MPYELTFQDTVRWVLLICSVVSRITISPKVVDNKELVRPDRKWLRMSELKTLPVLRNTLQYISDKAINPVSHIPNAGSVFHTNVYKLFLGFRIADKIYYTWTSCCEIVIICLHFWKSSHNRIYNKKKCTHALSHCILLDTGLHVSDVWVRLQDLTRSANYMNMAMNKILH
jgi:hypothetical protein